MICENCGKEMILMSSSVEPGWMKTDKYLCDCGICYDRSEYFHTHEVLEDWTDLRFLL